MTLAEQVLVSVPKAQVALQQLLVRHEEGPDAKDRENAQTIIAALMQAKVLAERELADVH